MFSNGLLQRPHVFRPAPGQTRGYAGAIVWKQHKPGDHCIWEEFLRSIPAFSFAGHPAESS